MATANDPHSARGCIAAVAAVTVAAGVGAGLYYHYYLVPKTKSQSKSAGAQASVSQLHIYPIKSCKGIAVSSAAVGSTGFLWDRWWMLVDERGSFVTQRHEPKMALIQPSILPDLLLKDPKKLPPHAVMTVDAPGMDPLEVPLRLPAGKARVHARVWEWEGQAVDVGADAAAWFSSYLGRPVRLVRFDTEQALRLTDEKYAAHHRTAFTDGFPYLLIAQSSLEQLNAKLSDPLLMNRFRPNICIEGCKPFEEDTWRTFVIGSEGNRVFHGVKPCGRCKVTTTNQETAEVGSEPLETLKEFRTGEELSLPKDFKKEVVFGMNVVCDLKAAYFRKLNLVVSVGDTVSVLERTASVAELTPP